MGLFWVPFGLKPKREAETVKYADINARALAACVDVLLLFCLLNPLFQLVNAKVGVDAVLLGQMQAAGSVAQMMTIIWSFPFIDVWLLERLFEFCVMGALFVSVQIIWGTTPGKWLLGLKIVRVNTLEPIVWWRYVLRFVGYFAALLPLMIGIFWISFNRERRGWQDYVAGTVVIHTRSYGWWKERTTLLYRKLRPRAPSVESSPE